MNYRRNVDIKFVRGGHHPVCMLNRKEMRSAERRFENHPEWGEDNSEYYLFYVGRRTNNPEKVLTQLLSEIDSLIYDRLDPEVDQIWIYAEDCYGQAKMLATAAYNRGFTGSMESKKDGFVSLEEYAPILDED